MPWPGVVVVHDVLDGVRADASTRGVALRAALDAPEVRADPTALRQMLGGQGDKPTDAGQVESALAYMERLVAERLAEANDAPDDGGRGGKDDIE